MSGRQKRPTDLPGLAEFHELSYAVDIHQFLYVSKRPSMIFLYSVAGTSSSPVELTPKACLSYMNKLMPR